MSRKTLLITGASSGIGAATAILAARAGYDIAIHYNSEERGAQTVCDMCEQAGAHAQIIQGDLSDPDAPRQIFERFDAGFAQLDALINNAGIVGPKSRIDEMDAERILNMTRINLIAPMLMAKEAVLRMSRNYGGDGGVIVNVSSMAAKLGAPGEYIDYAATKGGIDTFTRGLALELTQDEIRVNGVRPGVIETAIHAKGGQPDRAEIMADVVPMRRAGSAEEIAQAILFLVSDQSSYMTGATIDVSGGR